MYGYVLVWLFFDLLLDVWCMVVVIVICVVVVYMDVELYCNKGLFGVFVGVLVVVCDIVIYLGVLDVFVLVLIGNVGGLVYFGCGG